MVTPAVPGPPGVAPSALRRWAPLTAQVVARIYRAFLLTLLTAAMVPTLWSWSSFVVRSGSMEPSISVGDVVVAKAFSASEEVPVGRVIVFPNPAKPRDGELLVHRVVENLGNGEFATAGDANASYDASTITSEDVDARATLLVPFVGRPVVWVRDGDVVPLVLWGAVTALAFVLASRRSHRRRGDDDPADGDPPTRRPHRGSSHRRLAAAVPALALLVGGAGMTGSHTATAAFTGGTVTASNTWSVSGTLAHRISLASPGTPVRGTVPLTATVANSGSAYSVRMEYAPPGTSSWQTLCTKSGTPYSCGWATTGFANGRYDLRAVASSGTTTLTSAVVANVMVDNLAPTVTMQNPGTPLRGTVTLAAAAADAHSGVARVVVQQAVSGSTTYRDVCTIATAPYSCQVDTTTLANGTYSFRAVATDAAGTSTTSAAVTNRVVDNLVTSIVMNDPGPVLTGQVTLTASASSTAGVASVRIQGAPAGTTSWSDVCLDTTAPYSCTYQSAAAPDGLYDLRAIVTDGAGRTTTSVVVEDRRVDNTAPRASDVQTTNGGVAGRLDTGDTMSFTYSEQMRLASISPTWDGSAVPVSLRLRDGHVVGTGSSGDTVDVLRSGSAVGLGSVNLREDYVSSSATVQFAATMTATTVAVNGVGVGVTRVTITVGSQTSTNGTLRTVTAGSTMSWSPSGSATDLGGLKVSTATATESGTLDRQF